MRSTSSEGWVEDAGGKITSTPCSVENFCILFIQGEGSEYSVREKEEKVKKRNKLVSTLADQKLVNQLIDLDDLHPSRSEPLAQLEQRLLRILDALLVVPDDLKVDLIQRLDLVRERGVDLNVVRLGDRSEAGRTAEVSEETFTVGNGVEGKSGGGRRVRFMKGAEVKGVDGDRVGFDHGLFKGEKKIPC